MSERNTQAKSHCCCYKSHINNSPKYGEASPQKYNNYEKPQSKTDLLHNAETNSLSLTNTITYNSLNAAPLSKRIYRYNYVDKQTIISRTVPVTIQFQNLTVTLERT